VVVAALAAAPPADAAEVVLPARSGIAAGGFGAAGRGACAAAAGGAEPGAPDPSGFVSSAMGQFTLKKVGEARTWNISQSRRFANTWTPAAEFRTPIPG
jgi:hypothetical protein